MHPLELSDTALSQYDLVPPVMIYDLPDQGNSNTVLGVRTGTTDYVLKVCSGYEDLGRLHREHVVLGWLADQDLSFSVPAPIRTALGATVAWSQIGWQTLVPVFPGRRVNPEDLGEVHSFGRALGELLHVLQRHPGGMMEPALDGLVNGMPGSSGIRHSVPDLTLGEGLSTWLQSEMDELQEFVASTFPSLPRQLTHNDFIPSNVLSARGRVTAVLDFEFIGYGARALDIAMALLFCLRHWINPDQDDVVASLFSGYGLHNVLTPDEIRHMPQLLRLRNIISILWWLEGEKSGKDIRPALRIERARSFADWLTPRETRLIDTIARTLWP